MARETSIQAYKHIMNSGVLTERQTQLYEALYQYGPAGSREAWEEIKKIHPNIPQHSINPRFAELEREGVIKDVGKYECPYTKETVVAWDVTSKILAKRTKTAQPTEAQQLREGIAEFKAFLDRFDDASGDKKVTVRRVIERIRKALNQSGL